MSRAVSTVLGVLLLTALTLVLATVTGIAVVTTVPSTDLSEPVELSASVNATSDRITLTHKSGPTLDVREIEVRIFVDDTSLRHQPPVPFYGARGFWGAPSGPFNGASSPRWELGERASLQLAGSNDPSLSRGATVRIELYEGDLPIARVETTAR